MLFNENILYRWYKAAFTKWGCKSSETSGLGICEKCRFLGCGRQNSVGPQDSCPLVYTLRIIPHSLSVSGTCEMMGLSVGCVTQDSCSSLERDSAGFEEVSCHMRGPCARTWGQPSKKMGPSVLQPQELSSANNLNEFGRVPWVTGEIGTPALIQPDETWGRGPGYPVFESWHLKTEIISVCCFKRLSLW